MQHLRNSPTSWIKLVTCGNTFEDTIDPQENFFLTDYSERNRTINEWKGCKLIMCYPEKTIFRLSSHFKWMNRVSNLTAQIKLLHNLNLEWLGSKILWGFFHILGSYKTMDQQETEPAEPPEPVYFFFKRRGMCWVWSLLSGIKKNNLEEKYVLINHDVHFGMQLAVIYSEC